MKILFLFVVSVGLLFGAPAIGANSDVYAQFRLPRAMLAWFAGGGLALSGALMQTLLKNSLATPYTLGISSAGSFGAFLVLSFPGLSLFGHHSPQISSILFALSGLTLVIALSKRAKRAESLILAGITLNFLFGAGLLLVRHMSDPYRLSSLDRWMMGSVDVISYNPIFVILPIALIALFIIFRHTLSLDQLAFHDELAASRGVSVDSTKKQVLLAAGALTATVVSQTGPIGFVGLLVPHAVRPFTGLKHAFLLPACWLVGGAFLVVADTLARSFSLISDYGELPVGILTALIGGPLLLVLLLK